MHTFIVVVLFVLGIVIISKSGDAFLDGAVWLAETFKIPKVIIGATIVSIGTTLPELAVSLSSAVKGNVDLASSNVVGSLIANTGLIVSLCILFVPIAIKRKHYDGKIVILFICAALLTLFGLDGNLSIWESIVMLLVCAVYIVINLRDAKTQYEIANTKPSEESTANTEQDVAAEFSEGIVEKTTPSTALKNIAFLIIGAIGIFIGSELLRSNGIELAIMLGVPEFVIGFTAVALGTSIPELVTAFLSIRRGEVSISIGNVIGANIVCSSIVLPICSLINAGILPVPVSVARQDMLIYIGIISIIFIVALARKKFSRWQGVVGLLTYFSYAIYMFLQ